MRRVAAARVLVVGAMPLLGCPSEVVNADHCVWNGGDPYCAGRYPDQPYCENGEGMCRVNAYTGCVAVVAPVCHAPCGHEGCVGSSTSSETGSGAVSSSSESSESDASTTGVADCQEHADCSDAIPICQGGLCVGCDAADVPAAACAERDATLPACVLGECVQCSAAITLACVGTTPLCDASTSTCVGCRFHHECGEHEAAACHVALGSCFTDVPVLEVGMGEAYVTLGDALTDVPPLGQAVLLLHGDDDHDEAVAVTEGRVVAIKRTGTARWTYAGDDDLPSLQVDDAATVYLLGTAIVENASATAPAIRVSAGTLYADGTRWGGHANAPLLGDPGAVIVLRNAFVTGPEDRAALQLDASALTGVHVTIAGGQGVGRPLDCNDATVELRNSILVSQGDASLNCPGASITHSAVESPHAGLGNVTVGPLDPAWFVDSLGGDLHLQKSHPFADIAEHRADDPPFDFDGDARPGAGMLDVVGADRP